MTAKDYQLIADAIKEAKTTQDRSPCEAYDNALYDVANKLADKLAFENPNFNRSKFLTVCITN